MGLTTITAERTETEVPLELLVNDNGGVTGLTVVVAIRDGSSTTSWLDFSDSTFKTTGWTTRQAAVAQVSSSNAPGQYRRLLDVSAITNLPAATDFLVAEYAVSGTTTQNAQDIIQLVESYLNIPTDTDTALTAAHGAGSWATSTLSAAAIATAVWTEQLPGAFLASSAGFILGTNLDALISSRSSHSAAAAATAVWNESLPGTFSGGTAGNIVGNNLDVGVSTRSNHSPGDVDTTLTATHGAGSWATSTLSAAAIATAVWTEALPGAFLAGSAGFTLGTNLDALISSRSSHSAAAAATAVWGESLPGAYGAGAAGNILGNNLDVILSTRSSHSAANVDTTLTAAHGAGTWTTTTLTTAAIATAVWTEALPGAFGGGSAGFILGTNLDALISSRSSHSAAAAATAVWSETVPGAFGAGTAGNLLGNNLDAALSTRSSHNAADVDTVLTGTHGAGAWEGTTPAAVATAVWDEAIPGTFGAGSAGFVLGTNLDALLSSRSAHSAAAAATAVWGETIPGAFSAGTAGNTLGNNLDVPLSTRSSHTPANVDTTLSGAHGAGAWDGTNSDWTPTERNQIRYRLALDGTQTDPTTNAGTLEDLLASTVAAELTATAGSTSTEVRTGAGQADGFYDEMVLLAVNTAGVAVRRIAGYLNTNGAFTVTPALPFTPAVSDRVIILGRLTSTSSTAALAAAVWDEPVASHLGAGTTGATLDNASAQAGVAVALTASK